MINHLRTLLLNQAGSSYDAGIPGEEYIPLSFAAVNLPANLAKYRNLLLGSNADRALLNYRLRELLYGLHAGELAPYATDLDARITYWPPRSDSFFRGLTFGAAVQRLDGSDWPVSLLGDSGFTAGDNRILLRWQIQVVDGTQISITGLAGGAGSVDGTYSSSSGLSDPIALPGSPLSLRFAPGSAPYPIWEVTALARPSSSLVDILAALDARGTPSDLFGGSTEPYPTLKTVWQSTAPGPLRLAAFTLALGYRIEAVRVASSS